MTEILSHKHKNTYTISCEADLLEIELKKLGWNVRRKKNCLYWKLKNPSVSEIQHLLNYIKIYDYPLSGEELKKTLQTDSVIECKFTL